MVHPFVHPPPPLFAHVCGLRSHICVARVWQTGDVICMVDEVRRLLRVVGAGGECDVRIDQHDILFTVATPPSARIVLQVPDDALSDLLDPLPGVKLLSDSIERTCTDTATLPVFLHSTTTDSYYMFDPRVATVTNTVASPAAVSTEHACPTVARNFVNAGTCVPESDACAAVVYRSNEFTLDEESIVKFYEKGNKHVYYVTGLPPDEDDQACEGTSRWVERDSFACSSDTATYGATDIAATTAVLQAYLDTSPDNARTFDLTFDPASTACASADAAQWRANRGMFVTTTAGCYQHAHPDEHGVYDFSLWTIEHPGNEVALAGGRRNPIKAFADLGSPAINFPSHHDNSRWITGVKNGKMVHLGNLGDTIDYANLRAEAQDIPTATALGSAPEASVPGGIEACGSPNEVSQDPTYGYRYNYNAAIFSESYAHWKLLDQAMSPGQSKTSVWTNIALYRDDQLRQRVAWALSQILVIDENAAATNMVEPFMNYYDIFVRHAFGNYRDVMREVAFSPLMGAYLTFKGNKSFQASGGTFPDENFARELMQVSRRDNTRAKDATLPRVHTVMCIYKFRSRGVCLGRANTLSLVLADLYVLGQMCVGFVCVCVCGLRI